MQQGILTTLILLAQYGCTNSTNSPDREPEKIEAQKRWVTTCNEWDEWDKAGPAFQIHSNTYYVGTCGISSILIVGSAGHILIDGGTEVGASIISKNIESLGYRLSDIKILLHSHEHYDHVAGLAEIQKLSGANLLTSKVAQLALSTGNTIPSDPQFGMHAPFPAADVTRTVQDGEVVRLGNLSLKAIETPGHSSGALSWQWKSCEDDVCEWIVYADSLSPISRDKYNFSDHHEYLDNYQIGLEKLGQLNCTLILTPHPSASNMTKRLQIGQLIAPDGCINYSQAVKQRLFKRLKKEQATR